MHRWLGLCVDNEEWIITKMTDMIENGTQDTGFY